MDSNIISIVVADGLFLMGLFAFLVFDWLNTRCTNCGTRAPLVHGLWGGWTCKKCASARDRNGETRLG